jgi:hypothetical protein
VDLAHQKHFENLLAGPLDICLAMRTEGNSNYHDFAAVMKTEVAIPQGQE